MGKSKLAKQRRRRLKYESYIQSQRWQRRKVEYFFLREKICWRCGTDQHIHLHHHTYVRLGKELSEDLVPLCHTCHRRVHDLHREMGGSLTEATIQAIEEHPDHPVKFTVVLVEPSWMRRRPA